jgi:hypothetical protein
MRSLFRPLLICGSIIFASMYLSTAQAQSRTDPAPTAEEKKHLFEEQERAYRINIFQNPKLREMINNYFINNHNLKKGAFTWQGQEIVLNEVIRLELSQFGPNEKKEYLIKVVTKGFWGEKKHHFVFPKVEDFEAIVTYFNGYFLSHKCGSSLWVNKENTHNATFFSAHEPYLDVNERELTESYQIDPDLIEEATQMVREKIIENCRKEIDTVIMTLGELHYSLRTWQLDIFRTKKLFEMLQQKFPALKAGDFTNAEYFEIGAKPTT